jgi:hypothetical protein
VHIELEYTRGPSGRPEGTVRVGNTTEPVAFAGTIDLLRLLDELADTESMSVE